MKYIPLTQGKQTLVDDADFEIFSQWKWQLNGKYARRSWRENGKVKNMTMHRLIMNPSKDMQIDHINGDKLDNRKENLRITDSIGNNRNVNSKIGKSGYKGVGWYEKTKKWGAVITVDYKHIWLGGFEDPREAAKAYNNAAIKYFGEFARLNLL